MKLTFDIEGWEGYLDWQREGGAGLKKLNALIAECLRGPFRGTGRPEPLKGNLKGWWSRRIDYEHRLVYRVRGQGDGQALEILQCRYHY
ncbi:Txe/YoeB family addiction module toxin [Novosphingopyxis sp.]|uniref:Txe/YoeB family addiction module toxin n=1 Tax=Novosphingopyxis sp. TaxID=2709690 RepID=UPI003B5C219C